MTSEAVSQRWLSLPFCIDWSVRGVVGGAWLSNTDRRPTFGDPITSTVSRVRSGPAYSVLFGAKPSETFVGRLNTQPQASKGF